MAAPVTAPEWHRQEGFDVRFEWGPVAATLVPGTTAVIVDVLRFSTAVEAALSVGVTVHPFRWNDAAAAAAYASSVGAVLAAGDRTGPSLSPLRLRELAGGTAVVLPSPNGSTCAALAAEAGSTVVAACLRNAPAVGAWLEGGGAGVTVVACGERWADGSLRPCLEDMLGAGAVIAALAGSRSPEADAAAQVYGAVQAHGLEAALRASASGRELEAKGYGDDVGYAAEAGVSAVVPVLVESRFVDLGPAAVSLP